MAQGDGEGGGTGQDNQVANGFNTRGTTGPVTPTPVTNDPNHPVTTPTTPTTPTTTPTTPATPTTDQSTGTSAINPTVVANKATSAGQINVADYAGQIATNPNLALNNSELLSKNLAQTDPNTAGTSVDPNQAAFQNQASQPGASTSHGTATTVAQVDPRQAATYQAQDTQNAVAQNGVQAAQGTMNPNAIVDPNAANIDMQGTATGTNADGSVNYTGQALKDFASQDLNTVDKRATVEGQLQALQSQFQGPNGEPVIPAWAAATARNVSKIAAFKGMTGTAATAAMAQALMEASVPIAQQDASLYQTLTLQNLSNEQASTLNRANVLAKMDQVNADNRMAAAIQNSKNFMDLDLKNLDNQQQAAVINSQSRIQSILADANADNVAANFNATSQNDIGKFYDQLNTNIGQYNASQMNSMSQFNTSESDAQSRFNADLENNRQQFYSNMQYNIDTSNAKWRQSVTLANNDQKFQAAAADVKNLVGIQTEELNKIWDRSDALLDYTWKSAENQLDRDNKLAQIKLQGKVSEQAATSKGIGDVLGSVAGAVLGKIFG